MDDFRIKASDPDISRYADMNDRAMEWHAPVAHVGLGERPALTPEQQDKLTADIAELIHTIDVSGPDLSAMPVTTAPADDGNLHFKKQSDPGY